MSNAIQGPPVRFVEKPCVDPGVVPKRSLLKANVQDLSQDIEHSSKP
jgi:hypothetical protein